MQIAHDVRHQVPGACAPTDTGAVEDSSLELSLRAVGQRRRSDVVRGTGEPLGERVSRWAGFARGTWVLASGGRGRTLVLAAGGRGRTRVLTAGGSGALQYSRQVPGLWTQAGAALAAGGRGVLHCSRRAERLGGVCVCGLVLCVCVGTDGTKRATLVDFGWALSREHRWRKYRGEWRWRARARALGRT